ncbi:unnamed protein product (macronuclear) [Paramecium tetraurelia]|uniref:aspartate--tRNA ligase n=1 Tax=Paramecium tetraurelia TaxID=5888 RepID=A0CH59_PARTE|nr:uncharacterized protein GSPATT00007566001 [Paramecium tetraurelia]CAK70126.1 unnamed protein product [Paramecium tetraurelia]|eukprot:XP_001437523.1 hypothetical protein (macronuclear) [Paramecium tetraurelia strain d4-2]
MINQQLNEKQQDINDGDRYGDVSLIQQSQKTNRQWMKVSQINESTIGKTILLRARIHNSRMKGKIAFLVLRENWYTIQAVLTKGEQIGSQMIKYTGGINLESVVDIEAVVLQTNFKIKDCTQQVELHIQTIRVISRSITKLPFQIEEASRKIIDYYPNLQQQKQNEDQQQLIQIQDYQISQNQRLNNRVLDLRTPAKQAIFRVKSGIALLFRQFLIEKGFIEIHTPKLLGFNTKNNYCKFKLQYFNYQAFLSQSSCKYKQMCLMADFERVFEVSPAFRALHGNTHRELCEFICMDLEMVIKENYTELLDLTEELCLFILKGIEKKFDQEIQIIAKQFQFQPIKICYPIIKLTYFDAIKLLQEVGIVQSPQYYFCITNQKQLGKIVKEKYGTDFFILNRLPRENQNSCIMPCKVDPNFNLSYKFFLRGEEIASGHQRIHDPEHLNNQLKGIGQDAQLLKDYINSFRYGSYPHGGCAFGLERFLYLYFDLKNIRNASLFPRDSSRLFP